MIESQEKKRKCGNHRTFTQISI